MKSQILTFTDIQIQNFLTSGADEIHIRKGKLTVKVCLTYFRKINIEISLGIYRPTVSFCDIKKENILGKIDIFMTNNCNNETITEIFQSLPFVNISTHYKNKKKNNLFNPIISENCISNMIESLQNIGINVSYFGINDRQHLLSTYNKYFNSNNTPTFHNSKSL